MPDVGNITSKEKEVMILEKYDIVVVGAGPAGTTFAKLVASKGISVAVLEKRQAIGEPVRCGEGLNEWTLQNHKIKERHFVNQKINFGRFYSPNGKYAYMEGKEAKGNIIDRKIFDKHLAILAAKKGAKILTRTRVEGVSKAKTGLVVHAKRLGKKVDYHCTLLIAADGVESRTAKYMGINTTTSPVDITTCAQVELAGIKIDSPDHIDFYFGNEIAPLGYIWVFPKGKDRANVGVGIRANQEGKKAPEYLQEFLKKRGWENAAVVQDSCGLIQVGMPLKGLTRDRFMVIGTAARQVNAVHGGGIADAMDAAAVAADVAIEAFKKNDFSKKFLDQYASRWMKKYGKGLMNLVKIRRAFDHADDDDLNFFVEKFSIDLMENAKQGNFKKVVGALVQRPQILRLARYLI